MRRIAVAGIVAGAALGLAASAQAADLKPILKAKPMPPAFSWTGLYVGVNLGGIWGTATIDPSSPNSTSFPAYGNAVPGLGLVFVPAQFGSWPGTSASGASFLGGGQVGYSWQADHVVLGGEADIDGTHLRESSAVTLSRTALAGTQTITANYTAGIDWIATFRARLGYAQDRFLVYATGGLAVGGTNLNTAYAVVDPPGQLIAPAPLTAFDSARQTGWTLGVGGEWAFANTASVGIEYRHVDLGSHTFNIGWTDASLVPFVVPGTTSAKFVTDQVTARLNWRPWR